MYHLLKRFFKKYTFGYFLYCVWRFFLLKAIKFVSNPISRLIIRRDGYCIKYFPNPFFDDLFVNPKMVRDDEVFLSQYLREGDTYIDVGANIGTTSLKAALLVGSSGQVFAIEPHPITYAQLITNILINKDLSSRIHSYNVALGSSKGELKMTDLLANDANYISEKGIVSVNVDTLDNLFASLEKVQLLKIDVEGFEKFVLEGGMATLQKAQNIYFEGYEKQYQRSGYSFADIRALLERSGFEVMLTKTENKGIVLQKIEKEYVPKSVENFLATRKI